MYHISKVEVEMTDVAIPYRQKDLDVFDKHIELIKQEIEFERKTFGHAFSLRDSRRVGYLLDDLRALNEKRAEIGRLIQQEK